MSGNHERLNNAEIIELLPELPFDHISMLEIKIRGKWMNMLGVCRTISSSTCRLCKKDFQKKLLLNHLEDEQHVEALKTVEQFYHPAYTYAKSAEKLAKGEKVPQTELKLAIKKADVILAATAYSHPFYLKKIADPLPIKVQLRLFKNHKDIILKAKDLDPHYEYVTATMSLQEMQGIEFTNDTNKWEPLIRTTSWHHRAKFECVLCSKSTAGIICMNEHLCGIAHRIMQWKILAVRVKSNQSLTKNCTFRYGVTASVRIHVMGKHYMLQHFTQTQINEIDGSVDGSSGANSTADAMKNEKEINDSARLKSKNPMILESKNSNDDVSKIRTEEDNSGLIGVEYVIMATKFAHDPNPSFECCLCKYASNGVEMQTHLTSEGHRFNYIQLHFPDTLRKYELELDNMDGSDRKRIFPIILAKLALQIENHHGRSLPYSVPVQNLRVAHDEIAAKTFTFFHACQEHGPSFINLYTKDDIYKLSMRKDIRLIENHIPELITFIKIPGKPYLNFQHHDPDKRPKSRSFVKGSNKTDAFEKPRQVSTSERDDEHRKIVLTKAPETVAVENLYKKYRENPESHPSYYQEWDLFWGRRKKELVRDGVNYRTYNFQPEWVVFFRARLDELFDEDIAKIEKEQMCGVKISLVDRNNTKKRSLDKSDDRLENISVLAKRTRFEMPTQIEKWVDRNTQYDTRESDVKYEPAIRDNKSEVIHCLRILVALEDHLGSLGAKITNLLSQALTMEKACSNIEQLESCMLTPKNCTLLETAMEKLKGIVYAGLIDDFKLPGFKRVILHTEKILQYADSKGWRQNQETMSSTRINVENAQAPNNEDVNRSSLSNTLIRIMSAQKESLAKGLQTYPQTCRVSDSSTTNSYFGGAVNNRTYDTHSGNYYNVNETGLSSFNTRLDLIRLGTNPSPPMASDRHNSINIQPNPIDISVMQSDQQTRLFGKRRSANHSSSTKVVDKVSSNLNAINERRDGHGDEKWNGYSNPYYSW